MPATAAAEGWCSGACGALSPRAGAPEPSEVSGTAVHFPSSLLNDCGKTDSRSRKWGRRILRQGLRMPRSHHLTAPAEQLRFVTRASRIASFVPSETPRLCPRRACRYLDACRALGSAGAGHAFAHTRAHTKSRKETASTAMIEETVPSRHFASSSRGGGGGGGGSRNWVGAGASLAPSLALSALSARRQEEPAPRRRGRAVGAGARVSSADSALRRLGPRCPPHPPGRPWRLPRWDAPRHLPAPPAPSGRGGFCSIIGGPRRGAISAAGAPRCVPDPSARLARSLRPGECRQRRGPVLGAPGHAAAAAAELRAAVAPPVRRPKMPRPL
ncbi:PREDICTED: uncharacterized protein LOC101371714 [Odobenus rosmarus divergens]|uniref:Uncharacterized protein LOC101371714 n=1 Tax=Odobenus rosmarus divergens TaxID=9708 RepID=A0A9B0LW42_ODORO